MIPLRDDNPTQRVPALTIAIAGVNIAVFLYAVSLGSTGFEAFTVRLGMIPFEITHLRDAISPTPIPLYLTLFTSLFMHGGWLHLGGNMLYLWIFGNNIEDALGHFRFLGFYLFCGVVATLAHVASAPNSTAPLVGASGAIAGVLGAYMAAFPRARVHVLIFFFFFFQVVRIPALIVLGAWFIIQLANVWAGSAGASGGVAWYAHIAGFLAGYLIMRRRKRRLRRQYEVY